jgi:hypothetical protein
MAAAKTEGSSKKAKKSTSTKRSSGKPPSRAAKPKAEEAAQSSSVPDNAQLPATRGKVGVFGGPKDRGIKPDDKLALPTGPHFVYERVRSLNPKGYYCAMRWDYHVQHMSPEEAKRWWANKKLAVTNPKNSISVVVRAVDYGPHENTGLDISLSPGAAAALEVEVGDEVEITFADQRAAVGPVENKK